MPIDLERFAVGGSMAGFYGSEKQISLQKVNYAARQWMAETPGACNPGRFLGTDDPDLLGAQSILDIFRRDGVFGFRLVADEAVESISRAVAPAGRCRMDLWNVFRASAEDADKAAGSLVSAGPPGGFRRIHLSGGPKCEQMKQVQMFLSENGIAPFSGSLLSGAYGPASTIVLVDDEDRIAATAHGYFAHNRHSPNCRDAWAGLVAVAPRHRGKGLGAYINAMMVVDCIRELGAEAVHELVAPTNAASRKMVEASGLRLDPAIRCGMVIVGEERFTR